MTCEKCLAPEKEDFDWSCILCKARFKILMRQREEQECVFVRLDSATGAFQIEQEPVE